MLPEDHLSPYSPPTEVSGPIEILCPQCSSQMAEGELTSSGTIVWVDESIGTIDKFLSRGKKIGKPKTGLGYRLAAHYCPGCRVIVLKPDV